MAKTLDQLVQETLGAQLLTMLRMQTENETLHEHIKELEAKAAAPAVKDQNDG